MPDAVVAVQVQVQVAAVVTPQHTGSIADTSDELG